MKPYGLIPLITAAALTVSVTQAQEMPKPQEMNKPQETHEHFEQMDRKIDEARKSHGSERQQHMHEHMQMMHRMMQSMHGMMGGGHGGSGGHGPGAQMGPGSDRHMHHMHEHMHMMHCLTSALEWVAWFNNRRLLEPIGNIPPAEAEQRHYAMLDDPAMAA